MGFDFFLLSSQWRSLSHYLAPSQNVGSSLGFYIKSISRSVIFWLFHWNWCWGLATLLLPTLWSHHYLLSNSLKCVSFSNKSFTDSTVGVLESILHSQSLTASRVILSLLCSKPTYLQFIIDLDQLSLVQSLSHVWLFATPWTVEHRPPCPSPTPGACSNSCPSSPWCYPAISSSVIPFSSCPQSFPASGSFPMSQFFASAGQSIVVQLQHQSLQLMFRTDFL